VSSFNPEPEATVVAVSGSMHHGRRLRLGVKRGGRTFQSGRGIPSTHFTEKMC